MDPEKRDMAEFKRLRRYYKYNFANGDSDQSFITWCEAMCEKLNEETAQLLMMPREFRRQFDRPAAGDR